MAWYEDLVVTITLHIASQYVNTRFGITHMPVCGLEAAEPLILVQGVTSAAP